MSTTSPHGVPVLRSPAVRWGVRLALLVLAAYVLVAVVRFVRDLDLSSILQAMGRLDAWQLLVLLGLLLLRQVLAAVPLRIYVPGVSLWRATVDDLGAMTAATFAPAPGDILLRSSIFASWGVAVPTALAGSVLNALTLYVVRFATPLIAFVLLAVVGGQLGLRLIDLLSLCVSAALVILLLVVGRAEATATHVGGWLGGVVKRFRPSTDPARWAGSFTAFQHEIEADLHGRLPRGMLGVVAMIAADYALLLASLRFVGVTPSESSAMAIAMAFLFAYPLTLFPMQGAGVVDAAILVALAASGGQAADATTAGLLIWRAFTIGGTFLLGLPALFVWRRSARVGRGDAVSRYPASAGSAE